MAHEYTDSDHDDTDESSSDEENGFFDMEASEASSDAEPDEDYDLAAGTATTHSFPKFTLLPPELQEMVWKTFCSDLTTSPRVFQVYFTEERRLLLDFRHESHVDSMRALLAINKQTRALGLKYSPHRLELSKGSGIVPCHMERDILYVSWSGSKNFPANYVSATVDVLARAAAGLQNLAVDFPHNFSVKSLQNFQRLPSLGNVFVIRDAYEIATKGLTWCLTDKTHEYNFEIQESEDGIGNPGPEIPTIFCWPDPNKYGDDDEQEFGENRLGVLRFDGWGNVLDSEGDISGGSEGKNNARDWVAHMSRFRTAFLFNPRITHGPWPSDTDGSGSSDGDSREKESATGRRRIRVWPMALFDTEGSIQHFYDMKTWQEPWEDWKSDDSGDNDSSDSETDEYDSDGIDDEPVNDLLVTDDEDDLPPYLLHLRASSQTTHQLPAAQFSSDSELGGQSDLSEHGFDIPESVDEYASRSLHPDRRVVEVESEDSELESVTEAGSPPRTTSDRRARAIIYDSDEVDEGGGDEEDDVPQPACGPRRRARPIPVDSEDDDDSEEDIAAPPQRPRTGNRRSRPVLVDSTDDETDQDEEAPAPRPGKRKAHAVVSSESDVISDPDDSSDEDAQPKPVSLRKRLRMEHQQAQASLPVVDSDGTEAEEYASASDDEEGDVDLSGEEGMAMGMVEEGDEDDEEF